MPKKLHFIGIYNYDYVIERKKGSGAFITLSRKIDFNIWKDTKIVLSKSLVR